MKLANAVRDKGEAAKEEMRVFVSGNRIEKPETEAIIQISSTAKPQETKSQDEPLVVTMEDNTTVAKKGKKAKKGPMPAFKKKLQLKLGAGEGNGDKGEEEAKTEEIKQNEVINEEVPAKQVEVPIQIQE